MTRLSAQSLGPRHRLVAAWVELASILNDVIYVINRSPEKVYQDASVRRLSEASGKLLSWFMNLPPELQWTATCPISPEICALHIQFLSTMILLNRPFAAYMLNHGRIKSPRRRCLEGHTPLVSQQICTVNAIRISKLLFTYRQCHGASKIFSTINPTCLWAGVALISDIVSAEWDEDKTTERKWLDAILETFDEIIPWYPIAERSRNMLVAIMNACGLPSVPKQVSSSSRDAQAEILPDHRPTEALGTDWNTHTDLPLGLGFPFDSVYDAHDNSPMDIFAQSSHMMNFGGWCTEDPLLYGFDLSMS